MSGKVVCIHLVRPEDCTHEIGAPIVCGNDGHTPIHCLTIKIIFGTQSA